MFTANLLMHEKGLEQPKISSGNSVRKCKNVTELKKGGNCVWPCTYEKLPHLLKFCSRLFNNSISSGVTHMKHITRTMVRKIS